jgi:NAD(P)-dependent dehydrogenase (short-subunit alcohol dehydrogenase family)
VTRDKAPVWLVTGASRGLGAALVTAALDAGCRVAAGARSPGDVTERFGARDALLPVALDVTRPDGIAQAVAAVVARFGRIDILVNNAGFGLLGAVEEASEAEARAIFETNFFGVLNLVRAVLPILRAQRSGHVVNISSGGGIQGLAGYGLYCASKFAVEGLTESLDAELRPLGIHSTIVELGYTRTEFSRALVSSPTVIADYDASAGATRRLAAQDRVQRGWPNDPDKAARAIVAVTRAPEPPLRLPLGPDAIELVEHKLAFIREELERWRVLAGSSAT